MALLHRDDPVTDATVDCPRCYARDWVVRSPRLGGEARIVCRACGHVDGPYFELGEPRQEPALPPPVAFAPYVPEGFEWAHAGGWEHAATVTVEEPWIVVTTEDQPSDTAEALRDAVADLLGSEEPPAGRSHAARLLELSREDDRIEAVVSDLHVENGTLRVDGADVPAKVMRTGEAWAAHATVAGLAVIASSSAVPLADVSLVRATWPPIPGSPARSRRARPPG